MKIQITEEQYKTIKKKVESEFDEQTEAEPVNPEPETGASDTQTGAQGYPEVTKWSDIVGSKLTRGVANKINNDPRPDLVGREGPSNQLI